MPKRGPIGSYGQNQALRAHVWAENGPKTAETRPNLEQRDRILGRVRPSYFLVLTTYLYTRTVSTTLSSVLRVMYLWAAQKLP